MNFVVFLIATVAWAVLCRLLLMLPIHPVAVGAVWLIGFVWMTGYIAAGTSAADLLTKRWLQMMAGIVILASVGYLALS